MAEPKRIEEIMGFNRRIFDCACGKEIFYTKQGDDFIKFEVDDVSQPHTCTAIQKYDKECFDCHSPIKIYKQDGKWVKEEKDGSPHNCKDPDDDIDNNTTSTGFYHCADCDRKVPKNRLHSCDTDDMNDDY